MSRRDANVTKRVLARQELSELVTQAQASPRVYGGKVTLAQPIITMIQDYAQRNNG